MNILIVCSLGNKTGLGHYSRSKIISKIFIENFNANVNWLIHGKNISSFISDKFSKRNFFCEEKLELKMLESHKFDIIVFDIHSSSLNNSFENILKKIKSLGSLIIAIDGLINYHKFVDLIFIPSFYFYNQSKLNILKNKVVFGWDCFLIEAKKVINEWKNGKNILVLTGGSDFKKLGNTLPKLLNDKLPKNTVLNWIKGPFADKPIIPKKCNLKIRLHNAPHNLNSIMNTSNFAITVFGVSFFELLNVGVPTVVFSPYNKKDDIELDNLKKFNLAMVAKNKYDATEKLVKLMKDPQLAKKLSKNAKKQMKNKGSIRLTSEVKKLLA